MGYSFLDLVVVVAVLGSAVGAAWRNRKRKNYCD